MVWATAREPLERIRKRVGLTGDLTVLDHAWESAVGPMSSYARVVGIERARLVIEVPAPAYLQEILLRRKELIRKVNAHLSTPWLEQLTVRLHGEND